MRSSRLLMMAVLLTTYYAQPAHAQTSFEPLAENQALPAAARVPVNVVFRAARLEDALRNIAAQARLGLSYRPDLPDLNKRITMAQDSLPAGTAIVRLLTGTQLQALMTRTGTTVLLRTRAGVIDTVTDAVPDPELTAPIPLAEIVVNPSHFGIAYDIVTRPQTLTRQQIETLPQIGEDIYRAINRLPGLASNELSARFNVRGGDDQSMLVMLDGMELSEPYHLKDFDGSLSIIDVAAIGGVDLSTGGFGAEYGSRLTGVFDMRTTSPLNSRPSTSIGISLSNARLMSQGTFANGRGVWLASARRGYLDLLLDVLNYDTKIRPIYYDGLAKVVYQITPVHQVSFHALRAGDHDYITNAGNGGTLSSRYGSTYGWLNWKMSFPSGLQSNTQFSLGKLSWHRNGAEHDQYDDWDLHEDRTYDVRGVKQNWEYSSDALLLKWGGELRNGAADYDYMHRIRQSYVQNHTLLTRIDSTASTLGRDGSTLGAFASLRMKPWRALVVEGGVRWDDYAYVHQTAVSPRLNLALLVNERTTVRLALGEYAQPQQLYDLHVRDADTVFGQLAHARQIGVGVERKLTNSTSARLELYRRDESHLRSSYRNLQSSVAPVAEIERDRVRLDPSRGRAQGVEALLQNRGARSSWSVSYAFARAYDLVDRVEMDRPLDQRHTFLAEYTLTPSPRWNLSVSWQMHSGWPTTLSIWRADTVGTKSVYVSRTYGPAYQDRLPLYHRMDLRATRTIPVRSGRLSLFLDVFNVYNRDNALYWRYNVNYSQGTLRVNRTVEPLLPVLPTIGATWEF